MQEQPPGIQVTRLMFYSCFRCHTYTQAPPSDAQCHPFWQQIGTLCPLYRCLHSVTSTHCTSSEPFSSLGSYQMVNSPSLNMQYPLWDQWCTPFHNSMFGSPPTHFLYTPCAGQSCWPSGPLTNAPCSYTTLTTTHLTTQCHASEDPKPRFLTTQPPFSSF